MRDDLTRGKGCCTEKDSGRHPVSVSRVLSPYPLGPVDQRDHDDQGRRRSGEEGRRRRAGSHRDCHRHRGKRKLSDPAPPVRPDMHSPHGDEEDRRRRRDRATRRQGGTPVRAVTSWGYAARPAPSAAAEPKTR
ncbi:hypothetical protein ACE1SV_70910 [Streptomyces sennicomposti]